MKPTPAGVSHPVVVARMVVTVAVVAPKRWNLWPYWRPEQIHVNSYPAHTKSR